MTDDRKQYLASISKEERLIRKALYHQKILLRSEKYFLNVFRGKLAAPFLKDRLQEVCETKCVIKSLKKQLPAPVKFIRDGKWAYDSCSVCKDAVNEDELYCHTCGQKLR